MTNYDALNQLAREIHTSNVEAGWWSDLRYDEKLHKLMETGMDRATSDLALWTMEIQRSTIYSRNVGELLCLVHSEISEAMEGHRKGLMDDKLPHRTMFEVELADAVIRILDIAGAYNLDLGGAIMEKRTYNAGRADHKVENRLKDGGKAY